ncbi:MAG: dinuclear metal center YbgI/SA1388 family protein [Roseivirga sp.]|jgi:dinuclear metal center YbgI/SA1388 family protein
MLLTEIIKELQRLAPPVYQESYDNSRLLYNSTNQEMDAVLVCLDVTEQIIEEAIEKKAGLIISHHPLIFSGIKSLTGKNEVERAFVKAIKNDIAIFALHTNLDNMSNGVNAKIAKKLGVDKPRILDPKKGILKKLVVFVPKKDEASLSEALWDAGAGSIGEYDQCSYRSDGTGTFRPSAQANPTLGERGYLHKEQEYRLEVLVELHCLSAVLDAMHANHPYEEVAYELYSIENEHQHIGSGMYGDLAEPIDALLFLKQIKKTFGGMLRYTQLPTGKIQRIAWCGGSGSFLLENAKRVGAELFLSSDFKYHQFFEADNEILIADIGHYENEQFTIHLIAEYLRKKFPTFAVLLTESSTNPINYI